MLPGLYPHMLNGFLLSILTIIALRAVARDLRLVDLPDARKLHDGAVPLCGGLAIFAAFVVAGLGLDAAYRLPWNWGLGFLLLVTIGVADDRWHLPPLPRLTIQALAAGVLSAGGGALLLYGREAGVPLHLPEALAAVFSAVFIVGTVNAVNMLDGADGLAGATAVSAMFWLSLIATYLGDRVVAVQALVLISAVLGFLAFNMRHPWRGSASIFLGDAGGMILGGVLAVFILHLARTGRDVPAASFVALLWLVIVPVCDTLSLIVRRMAVGRSPLSPDRWHLHHLLLDLGVPPAAIAPLVAGISALCGAAAYLGIVLGVPDVYLALGLILPVSAHTAFVMAVQGVPGARTAAAVSDGGRLPGRILGAHRKGIAG